MTLPQTVLEIGWISRGGYDTECQSSMGNNMYFVARSTQRTLDYWQLQWKIFIAKIAQTEVSIIQDHDNITNDNVGKQAQR